MNRTGSNALIEKIERFISKYYKDRLLRGAIYSVALLLVAYLTVTLLEYFGQFGVGVRTALFWTFLALAIGVLVRFVVIPLFHLFRLGKTLSQEEASKLIGQHFDGVKDKLTNTLQLTAMRAEAEALERELIDASLNSRSKDLEQVQFTEAIDLSGNRRYLKYALPPLLVVVVLIFAAPTLLTESTERLLEHRTLFLPKAPFEFEVLNEELLVPELGDFTLKVRMSGDAVPRYIYLDLGGTRVRATRISNTEHEYTFRNVSRSKEFLLEADGFVNGPYELNTLPSPTLTGFEVLYEYPKYLGMTDKSEQNIGDMVVPAGTQVTWNIHTRNTKELELNFQDSSAITLRADVGSSSYKRRFFKSDRYSIRPNNEFIAGEVLAEYRIQVLPDLFPGIMVEERRDSISLKRTYFRGLLEDDHGIKELYFHYDRLGEGSDSLPRSGRVKLAIPVGLLHHEFFHVWDLSELKIGPGEEVSYFFEVWDNDGVNGSKSSRTPLRTFRAPSLEELSQKREEQSEQIEENIEESIKEAKELQEELERLNKDLTEKKNLDWQDQQRVEQLMERQKELEKRLEQVKEQNRSKNLEQNEFRQPNEELLEKQMRIEELFEELMSEEMKQLYDELQKLLEEMNKDMLQEKLEEIQLTDEEIEKELDRSLEIFKQMEFELKLEDLTNKLEELAKEQKELSEETQEKDADQEELKDKQDELNEKFNELKKDMEELEQKNEELEEKHDMPDMDKAAEQIDHEMQESSEQLEKENNKKASESQQDAAEQMEQMAMQMQSMMQSGQQQQMEEDLDALRALLENLIELSFGQEDLMAEVGRLKAKDPRHVALGQAQKKLKDDAQVVEDSLFALSKRIPQLSSAINKEIASVNHNMEKAVELINEAHSKSSERPKAAEKQQYVMTSLNDLALLLDEAMQQMQQQMAMKMPGTGNCQKPGGSGSKPNMSKMSGMQKQLQKQLEEMKKQMGSNPGSNPGGQKGMSKELAKMAAQQAAIRKEVQKMAQSLDEGGKGGGKGLKEIANKMEQVERDIVNKQITQETIERQKDIVTRLLESEKAEREREMDHKRRSTEAREKERNDPGKYFEYNKLKEREAEMLRTIPPALRPYYKQKVNEYFSTFGRP